MKIKLECNNSGGYWWLSDEDWKNLEKAGWKVRWFAKEKHPEKPDPDCKSCKGTGRDEKRKHAAYRCMWCFENIYAYHGERWLGGLAKKATKECKSVKDAIVEFEKITGQNITSEGCNCCGPPFTLHWGKCNVEEDCDCKGPHKDYHYASGDELLKVIYPDRKIPKTIREMLEANTNEQKEN